MTLAGICGIIDFLLTSFEWFFLKYRHLYPRSRMKILSFFTQIPPSVDHYQAIPINLYRISTLYNIVTIATFNVLSGHATFIWKLLQPIVVTNWQKRYMHVSTQNVEVHQYLLTGVLIMFLIQYFQVFQSSSILFITMTEPIISILMNKINVHPISK